jgi:hypothetical protein
MLLADGRQAAAAGHRRRAGCRPLAGVTEHATTPRQKRITGARATGRGGRSARGLGWRSWGKQVSPCPCGIRGRAAGASPAGPPPRAPAGTQAGRVPLPWAEQTPGARGEPVARRATSAGRWSQRCHARSADTRQLCTHVFRGTPYPGMHRPECGTPAHRHCRSAADAVSVPPTHGWVSIVDDTPWSHPGPIAEGAVEGPPVFGELQVASNETRSSTSGKSMPIPLPAGKIPRCSSTRRPGSRGPVAARVATRTVPGTRNRDGHPTPAAGHPPQSRLRAAGKRPMRRQHRTLLTAARGTPVEDSSDDLRLRRTV